MKTTVCEKYESNVRYYCRGLPDILTSAKGTYLYTASGRRLIDFLAGSGALNYGHNHDYIKHRLMRYIGSDHVVHGLDFRTEAKQEFMDTFVKRILEPRRLPYKMQFCGPTGTNAVEAALKLARKVTGRTGIFSFMGSFHGVTLGSLQVTGKKSHRNFPGFSTPGVTFMPCPYGFMETFDTLRYFESVLDDNFSGVDLPAAVIVETVQADGGVIVFPEAWLQRLAAICRDRGILLICDEIQVGCGRTGTFFSFERAGIVPDLVTLSKSIGGYGLPLSLLLVRRDHDVWSPGEHNGTFRGHQLAFVCATAALELYCDGKMEEAVSAKARVTQRFMERRIAPLDPGIQVRGLGLLWGIDFTGCGIKGLGRKVQQRCVELNLLVENVGRNGEVLKILPPLTTDVDLLLEGFEIIRRAIEEVLAEERTAPVREEAEELVEA